MSIHDLRSKHQGIGINTRDRIDGYECQRIMVDDTRTVTKEMVTMAYGKRPV